MNNQGEIFLYERAVKSSPEINIWLAFPAIRNFGLSSLGYMSIFKTLDSRSDYYVERIFKDSFKISSAESLSCTSTNALFKAS